MIIKQREIIHITNVFFNTQRFFDKMIERIQVDIREKLAGQIANRQAAPPLARREQIVARKIVADRFLRIAAVNDQVKQPKRLGAFDFAPNQGF